MHSQELQKLYDAIIKTNTYPKWKIRENKTNKGSIWDYEILEDNEHESFVISAGLTDPREVYYEDLPQVQIDMDKTVADFIVYVFNNCQDIINKLKDAEREKSQYD